VRLVALHGWGFDGSVWRAIAARLPEHDLRTADRGYFGNPIPLDETEPFVAIGHSLGALLLLLDGYAPLCRGLVAINGFDRFVASANHPGIGAARRPLDRMIARLRTAPAAVVSEFRARCGAAAIKSEIETAALERDLLLLRDADGTAASAAWHAPILSLQGGADWLLSTGHRAQVFALAEHVERSTHPSAGHGLPWAEPDWCADHIRRFARDLA
jgi:pimeloyl-[acyl-carrier protein] methyl ester esterase